jgi:hypothetical protein
MVKINLEIDDELVEFNLPQSWDEVSIGEFVKIFSFEREGLSMIEVVVETISLLSGVPQEKFYMLPVNEFQKLAEELAFVNTELKGVDVDFIVLDGEEYWLKKDFSSFTMGEVISIETILEQGGNNLFKVMDKLLCIFLRKKKENGKLEAFTGEFMARAELFKTTPVSSVLNIFNFFLNGGSSLLNNMNPSLENPPKQKRKSKVNLKTSKKV